MEALQYSFCVCLICLHHFSNICILSGIWCSRFILSFPTPAIFLPFKFWPFHQVTFPPPPYTCLLCSAWTLTPHTWYACPPYPVSDPTHHARLTPLCGYVPHLAQILIPCMDILSPVQAPTPHTSLLSSADNFLIPLSISFYMNVLPTPCPALQPRSFIHFIPLRFQFPVSDHHASP